MERIKKTLAVVVCTSVLACNLVMPMAIAEGAYVPTVQLENYDPFEGMEKEEPRQEADKKKDPAEMTFKERMAAKRVAAAKATSRTQTVSTSSVRKGNAFIPGGLKMSVELLQPVSSKGYKKGTLLKIRVLDNVIINDVVVVEKGSEGTAYIYQARKAGGLGRKGKLKIAGNEVKAVNGIPIPLRGGLTGQGKTAGGAGVVFALVTMAGGLLMKGSNVGYPAGTVFDVEVREDTDLGCRVEDLAKAMDPAKPHGIQVMIK